MRKGLLFAAIVLLATPALAVVAPQGGQRPRGADITLVYEREVFSYAGGERRDPFRPLTQESESGPRFRELVLQGIIYSSAPGESLAILRAGEGRVLRARVGDLVGNARVIEISPTRVVMAVENFGTIRQEILELPQRGGAER